MFRWFWVCIAVAGLPATTSPASAQDLCEVVSTLFSNAPAGFVSQRGAALGERRWASRLTLPNAECEIRVSSRGASHTWRCMVNKGASGDVVTAFFRRAEETDIPRCIARLPAAAKFTKSVDRNDDDGLTAVVSEWTYTESATDFSISVGGYRRQSDGYLYNVVRLEFAKD